jgi:hypothetical protein
VQKALIRRSLQVHRFAMNRQVYTALLHYPIIDKNNLLVSTSVTNLDIHDISRTSRTYGIAGYFIVTPIEAQHWLVGRIIKHWNTGWGSTYNSNRKDALSLARVVSDIATLVEQVQEETGQHPLLVGTSAKCYPNSTSYEELRSQLKSDGPPVVLVFGTGWGLHPELLLECDYILEPIWGTGDFNHLSVRGAVAIILDRLLAKDRPALDTVNEMKKD